MEDIIMQIRNHIKLAYFIAIMASIAGTLFSQEKIATAATPENLALLRKKLAPFWDVTSEQPVSYLYAPGSQGSEIAMARYCPSFTAATGEKISATAGGNIIGAPHSAVCFPEIYLKKPRLSWNPLVTILSGVRKGVFPAVYYAFNKAYGLTVIDNPDSPLTVANYLPTLSSNMGQEQNIKTLAEQYKKHKELYPNTKIVFHGDSRGAMTMFNFMALHKPTDVKCAVLEGMPDSIPHVIKHYLYENKHPFVEKCLHKAFEATTTEYRPDGITPRDCAEIIDDTVPLLFVASLKDEKVHPHCPITIYNRLRERGHKNVHMLILKNASHLKYMLDNKEDQQLYETTVHAFYKQYGAPHNAEKAALGQKSFATSQPTAKELAKKYPLPQCPLCIQNITQKGD
jgi:hypothetical protein